MKRLLCFTLAWACMWYAQAQLYHTFYDSETLNYWNNRYAENIRYNFEQLIRPRIESTIRLSLPNLPSPKVDAFNCYSHGSTIVIPTSAVLFFDQLCVANAWLTLRGYSIETILDYTGMLKYKPFKIYPLPLPSLQIPDNALSDKQVDAMSQEFVKTGALWIIAHEAGHIMLGHDKSTMANEIAADEFANGIFKDMGIVPSGIVVYFLAYMNLAHHRGDFTSDAAWLKYTAESQTHPLPLDRLKAAAQYIGMHAGDYSEGSHATNVTRLQAATLAAQLQSLAETLGDEDLQRSMRTRAMQADVEDLGLRKSGEIFVPKISTNYIGFNGRYTGIFTRYLENKKEEQVFVRVDITTAGDTVYGKFNFGIGIGKVRGKVVNKNIIDFRWSLGDSFGKGRWEKNTLDSPLFGTWGYNQQNNLGGLWKLNKDK